MPLGARMSDVDTKALRKVLDALPGGTWRTDRSWGFIVAHVPDGDNDRIAVRTDGAIGGSYWAPTPQDVADGIAALRNDASAMLDEIDALRAKVKELETQIERMEWDAMGDDL